MAVDWRIAQEPSAFDRARDDGIRTGEMIRQRRQEEAALEQQKAQHNALAAYAVSPSDRTFNALAMIAPQIAMQERGRMEERQFGNALSDYMQTPEGQVMLGGSPSQMGGRPPVAPQPQGPQMVPQGVPAQAIPPQAGPVTMQGMTPNNIPSGSPLTPPRRPVAPQGAVPQGMPQPSTSDATQPAPLGLPETVTPDAAPDLSYLGEPQNGRDRAFLRMVQIDPVRALQIQSSMREGFVDRLKSVREMTTFAMESLGRVTDDAGWQAALGRFLPMVQAVGGDLSNIPANYPGPEAVQELLDEGLPLKERLDYLLDQANVDADNARADRNTDSLIDSREGSLAERQRTNRAREGTAERRESRIATNQNRPRPARSSRPRASGGTTGGSGNLPVIASPQAAANLAPGTQFRTPDGRTMRVPQR